MTRNALLDKIFEVESFIDELDYQTLPLYARKIAEDVNPSLSLFLPYHISLYVLCRISKPTLVVETGVERGSSTYVILKALQTNGNGRLVSVELRENVPLGRTTTLPLALVVREGERNKDISLDNWTLRLGNSLEALPKLKDEYCGKVNIFVHGSDHGYEVQKAELAIAEGLVPKNGIVIVDRPDYNNFKAVNEMFSDNTKYAVTTLPEKSIHSSLAFSIVKKLPW